MLRTLDTIGVKGFFIYGTHGQVYFDYYKDQILLPVDSDIK